jgi:hypothetical protein
MWPREHSVFTVYAPIAKTGDTCFNRGSLRQEGLLSVLARSNSAIAVVVTSVALSLAGCDDTAQWFAKPLNPFNRPSGYTYSSLGDPRVDRPITANDLVDANGACPNYTAPALPPPPAAASPGEGAQPPQDGTALFVGGIALGMSECDVVSRLGQATAVNFGTGAYGSRNVVLTYNAGPRPGIYRFNNGRLSEMDRVDAPPPTVEKKAAKKKPAKPADPKS